MFVLYIQKYGKFVENQCILIPIFSCKNPVEEKKAVALNT